MARLVMGEIPLTRVLTLKWPSHKASLHLTHNQHLAYYMTVEECMHQGDHGYREDDWVSPEQKQKAIETNDCWSLQWYPETPLGSCILVAADLDILLAAACMEETGDTEPPPAVRMIARKPVLRMAVREPKDQIP